ncbi:DUF4180 domain-containing protein [Archangium primigenium]|uniref:DUF4180 domain-containing protein n=1 Tax=[Archangium] primigenium TaxID=2792470 RepID=UPI001EF9A195|nr:DUF4180 domain-containing protein [Archangium primigenium]MBM7114922.1 DUF4180 domain-containing protein [Archangium primigenium]
MTGVNVSEASPTEGRPLTGQTLEVNGVRVLELSPEGPRIRDASELLSLAWEHEATLVAIPAVRLGEDFFKLATGVAGELAQKFVNYRMRLAILGDISAHVAHSKALHGFVYESNRGASLWFVADREALVARLS